MAQIVLDPGEMFEHFHADHSETTLLEGEVALIMPSGTQRLRPDQTVSIPADTAHTLHNTGRLPARVACIHRPPADRLG